MICRKVALEKLLTIEQIREGESVIEYDWDLKHLATKLTQINHYNQYSLYHKAIYKWPRH